MVAKNVSKQEALRNRVYKFFEENKKFTGVNDKVNFPKIIAQLKKLFNVKKIEFKEKIYTESGNNNSNNSGSSGSKQQTTSTRNSSSKKSSGYMSMGGNCIKKQIKKYK
jgi:hypothetical protein